MRGKWLIVFALAGCGRSAHEIEVCAHLSALPQIHARVGRLESCKRAFWASGKIDDWDTFVFSLEGSKASGVAIVKSVTIDDGTERFEGILLRVKGAEIVVEGSRPPTEEP